MHTETRASVQACLRALGDELSARSASDRALAEFAAEVAGVGVRADTGPHGATPDHRALSSLDRALAMVPSGSRLCDAVLRVAPRLDWFQVFDSDEIDPHLGRNMIAAVLATRRHSDSARSLHAGLFLLAPETDYPLHTHGAAEVYYCVSGKLTLRHGVDGGPFFLRPGEYSITPCERLHALKTEDEPVLLVYVWLTGANSENWWWSQEADGSWARSQWTWRSDGRWVRLGREPVDPDTMRQARGVDRG